MIIVVPKSNPCDNIDKFKSMGAIMARKSEIEFANFTCRFGEKKVLLDLAKQVVLPAFLDRALVRSFGNTQYFFHETELIQLESDDNLTLGLAGRFVKNTVLEREQVFDGNSMIKDHQKMLSSPSALFLLILNNHKLIYLPETINAPNTSSFEATADKFIKQKHREFVDRLFNILRDQANNAEEPTRVTKKSIFEEYPYPSVEVIPLSSDEDLEKFINQYSVLRGIKTKLIQTNNETNFNPLFEVIRNSMDDIGSKQTVLSHNNSSGLSKEVAIKQLKSVAQMGNARINLEGKDVHGSILRGDNNRFRLRVPIENVSDIINKNAKRMYSVFKMLIDRGTLKISEDSGASQEKMKDILESNRNDDQ